MKVEFPPLGPETGKDTGEHGIRCTGERVITEGSDAGKVEFKFEVFFLTGAASRPIRRIELIQVVESRPDNSCRCVSFQKACDALRDQMSDVLGQLQAMKRQSRRIQYGLEQEE